MPSRSLPLNHFPTPIRACATKPNQSPTPTDTPKERDTRVLSSPLTLLVKALHRLVPLPQRWCHVDLLPRLGVADPRRPLRALPQY